MKKLNITKEQFNRSRYFQRKYGKLEYVSESGKYFKTNKGKVLMFREHHDPEGFTKNPEIQKLSKKVLSQMKRMRKMLDEWDISSVSEKYKLGGNRIEITLKAGRDDSFSSIGGGRVLTLYVDTGLTGWRIFITADEQITYPYLFRGEDDVIEVFNVFLNQFSRDFDDYIAELDRDEMDNAYTESKKFGKKFNESSFQVLDSDGETTTLSRECPFCHREHHITIDIGEDEFYDRYDAMRAGELIQRAFPMLDANQREFIKTGICDTCWDSL